MSEDDLDDLAEELSEFAKPEPRDGLSVLDERVIAGFEDIQRFVAENNRRPQNTSTADIFERLYAIRLERLRTLEASPALLGPLDHQGLLSAAPPMPSPDPEMLDVSDLAVVLSEAQTADDLYDLRHVPSSAERREVEMVATRRRCKDFAVFQPLFKLVEADLKNGIRATRPFVRDAGIQKAEIRAGQFFILGGQTVHVADVGAPIRAPNGETDARLRVIFNNGTESDLLLRSLQRALYKDEHGRRITEPHAGPLFGDHYDEADEDSGVIYVLRSGSSHPIVRAYRDLVHKIGVTGGSVERRIAHAQLDPTFLMADVEIVATYTLYNVQRAKLESLLHRLFEPARLDIEIMDRLGHPIRPQEWFMVPLSVIDAAVGHIRNETIAGLTYDPQSSRLIPE